MRRAGGHPLVTTAVHPLVGSLGAMTVAHLLDAALPAGTVVRVPPVRTVVHAHDESLLARMGIARAACVMTVKGETERMLISQGREVPVGQSL